MIRLPDLKRVSYPESVEEAADILEEGSGKAVPYSGGVSFVFAPMSGVEELVCLHRLSLNYITKKDGGLRIGAGTLIGELVESRAVKNYADGILFECARRIGSTLNRNLISVGGNLIRPFIWSDLSTVARALQASVRVEGKNRREIPAEEFFSELPARQLHSGDLVTEIVFPKPGKDTRAFFEEFTLTEIDFALLKVAMVLTGGKKSCRQARIVVGGATILPQRAEKAEEILGQGRITADTIDRTAAAAGKEIKITRDIRCSEKYKRDLCRGMIKGLLEEIY